MNATAWIQGIRSPAGLRASLAQRAPEFVTWALALALAVQAALIVTRLAGAYAPGGLAAVGATQELVAPAPRRRPVDLAALVNAHLFGAAPAAEGSGSNANAPATNLALVLAGVLAADDPLKGIAILGEAVTSAKVFAVGQTVPGGARLHAVYSDRVILDRNGALESLFLPRQRAAGPAQALSTLPGAAPENALLERMRKLVTEDPSVIGEILRPQVVSLQGKVRGFRVYPGRNRQAFTMLGLRSGDLVTSINGTPLDDTNRGNEIFRTLSSASEAHVTVIRNGEPQDLVLNLSQIAAQAQQITSQPAAAAGPAGTEGMAPGAPQPAVPAPPQTATDSTD
jgi:general secretion pathway protein C